MDFGGSKHIIDFLLVLVDLCFNAGHVDVVDMLCGKETLLILELCVVRNRDQAEFSSYLSELERERSWGILCTGAWLRAS